MTSNVKVCTPSEIHKLLSWGWPGLAKTCKNRLIFQTHGCKSLCQSRVKYF